MISFPFKTCHNLYDPWVILVTLGMADIPDNGERVKMTKREMTEQIRQMKEFGAKVSKKQAVDTLKAAGIMNSSGKVKQRFKKALRVAS